MKDFMDERFLSAESSRVEALEVLSREVLKIFRESVIETLSKSILVWSILDCVLIFMSGLAVCGFAKKVSA